MKHAPSWGWRWWATLLVTRKGNNVVKFIGFLLSYSCRCKIQWEQVCCKGLSLLQEIFAIIQNHESLLAVAKRSSTISYISYMIFWKKFLFKKQVVILSSEKDTITKPFLVMRTIFATTLIVFKSDKIWFSSYISQ